MAGTAVIEVTSCGLAEARPHPHGELSMGITGEGSGAGTARY